MFLSRLLALTGPGTEGETDFGWHANLAALRKLVLLHVAARSFLTLPSGPGADLAQQLVFGVTVAVALVGWIPGLAAWCTRGAALLVLMQIVQSLPFTANHVFLEILCLTFFALLDEDDEREAPLLLASLRWTIGVMFFYTGLQKALWGTWFDGQFLAFLIGTEDRFAAFFQHFVPAEELERLRSYNERLVDTGKYRPHIGSGPYRVDSVLFLAISNCVWLFEAASGIALLVPRLRRITALLAIAFVAAIEVGARELTFGILMVNLLLLSLEGPWVKKLLPLTVLAYAWLVAAQLGLVPMFDYSPA